jgi:diguanylate cyclase (GGDEF)-like protein
VQDHPLRPRVEELSTRALTGDCDELLAELDGLLRRADDPGWTAVLHALVAVVRHRAGTDLESFDSFVTAEQALARTDHSGLQCAASRWLAVGYYRSRLYELAVPHARHAARLAVDLGGAPLPAAPFHLTLSGIHLRWADEVRLLGDPALQPQVDDLVRRGEEAGRRAAELLAGVSADVRLAAHVELVLAGATAARDPERAVERLARVLERLAGEAFVDDRALVHPQLAQTLTRLGRLDEAREHARRGLACLHDGTDLPTSITAQQVALQVEATAGDAAAAAGLQLARTLARGWWEQRLRDLQSVRNALAAQELRTLHRIAHRDARQDPLTGVGNRRALDERLAAADHEPLAVVLMDLDRFKAVNDTLGHVAGDALLCRMADRIRDCARPDDLVARLGGDEFVVVCSDPDGLTAELLVQRLRDAFAPGWSAAPEAAAYGLGVSVGHASTHEGLRVDELLSAADVRLYADKGRNRAAHEQDRRVGAGRG